MGNGEFDLRTARPVVLNKIDTPTIPALNGSGAALHRQDSHIEPTLRDGTRQLASGQ